MLVKYFGEVEIERHTITYYYMNFIGPDWMMDMDNTEEKFINCDIGILWHNFIKKHKNKAMVNTVGLIRNRGEHN